MSAELNEYHQQVSMMHVAHKMSVEVVHIGAPLTASVAFPGVGIAMEASVQEIEGLVRENNVTVLALPLTTGCARGHDKTRATRFVWLMWVSLQASNSNRRRRLRRHDYSLRNSVRFLLRRRLLLSGLFG